MTEQLITAEACAAACQSEWRPSLVDVRSPAEFASGHIPGSVNVPMDQLESRLADLDFRRPAILVCQSGARAATCAALLTTHRLDVLVLQGGLNSWNRASLPSLVTTATRWSLERQVRFGAGLLVLISLLFTAIAGSGWLAFTAFVGLGLTFSGATNICLMGNLLTHMPWNRPAPRKPSLARVEP